MFYNNSCNFSQGEPKMGIEGVSELVSRRGSQGYKMEFLPLIHSWFLPNFPRRYGIWGPWISLGRFSPFGDLFSAFRRNKESSWF